MESDRRWRWYALLAALRVVLAVSFLGMIHPDEFFQSQEVMAQHVLQDQPLSRHLFIPWEYQLPMPNRSVLFPYAAMILTPLWRLIARVLTHCA